MAKDTAVLMMGNPAPTDDSDEYVGTARHS